MRNESHYPKKIYFVPPSFLLDLEADARPIGLDPPSRRPFAQSRAVSNTLDGEVEAQRARDLSCIPITFLFPKSPRSNDVVHSQMPWHGPSSVGAWDGCHNALRRCSKHNLGEYVS